MQDQSYGIDWNSITILNDRMFGYVMHNEERCKQLLEEILECKIERVVFLNREHLIDPGIGSKVIRMDVYVADDKGTVYDVEMQKSSQRALLKRARYYQAVNDVDQLQEGMRYQELRRSYVIFICPFDPFGKGLRRYTFRMLCQETEIDETDDTTKIFLNARGTKGEVSDELSLFLGIF